MAGSRMDIGFQVFRKTLELGILSEHCPMGFERSNRPGCRKSRRRNTRWLRCGIVERGAGEDRLSNGAHCPRLSVVLGDVIDIGESALRDASAGPISRLRE